jgi:hypothetical protein
MRQFLGGVPRRSSEAFLGGEGYGNSGKLNDPTDPEGGQAASLPDRRPLACPPQGHCSGAWTP